MEIIYRSLGELIPYENNPRNNDGAVKAVANSIKEFGFKVPIVIDKNDVIVAGHTRFKASAMLGLETVPCIVADDLSEEQVKAYRLADNKVAELADWDLSALDMELEGIDEIDMEQFGFVYDDINEEDVLERQKREFEERMASGELSEDSEEYQEFLAKFEAKKTTDDCYTPPIVYDAVADYVSETYNIKKTRYVRPFVPQGDYEHYNYSSDAVVVDNPPFSILSEIVKFYGERGIKYFLFCQAMTPFSSSSIEYGTVLCVGVSITYENGAVVNTSFLTNLEPEDIAFRSAPKLYKMVTEANEKNLKEMRSQIPKYAYPLSLITAIMLTPYSRYGIDFSVKKNESVKVSALDSQKEKGKTIYGKGFLISDKKKAERERAERERAERERAERERAERKRAEREKAERERAEVWELSEREIQIIKGLK